jgi:hypothetical protein
MSTVKYIKHPNYRLLFPTHEAWDDYPGWEGYYMVSTKGRVKSLDRKVPTKKGRLLTVKGRLLKQQRLPAGYAIMSLCRGNKYTYVLVHQMVLETWVGPKQEGMEVCHRDGDKTNNRLENLRWDTRSNNCIDRLFHGVSQKLSMDDVKRIRKRHKKKKVSYASTARIFKVSPEMISNIVRLKSWRFG